MGGTFDNVDQGAVVWGEYAGFGWLESFGWWCPGFFECILLGPGDPDRRTLSCVLGFFSPGV